MVGFLIGNVITGMREGSQWKEAVENGLVTLSYAMPYVMLILNLGACFVAFSMYRKQKRLADAWDGEDEYDRFLLLSVI